MAHDEWYTPKSIIQPMREIFFKGKIDLDPASCEVANKTIKAKVFFTKATTGFPDWFGNVWLNPPYTGTQMQLWAKMAHQQWYENEDVDQIVMLVNRSDAGWYQDFIEWASHSCYYQLRNRVKFIDGVEDKASSPRYPNDLFYFGNESRRFNEFCLEHYGKPVPSTYWKL